MTILITLAVSYLVYLAVCLALSAPLWVAWGVAEWWSASRRPGARETLAIIALRAYALGAMIAVWCYRKIKAVIEG